MSTYSNSTTNPVITLDEVPLYGSSRVGVYQASTNILQYVYEITDHLGSVRATFTADANKNATIQSTATYYPYGSTIASMTTTSNPLYNRDYQGQYALKDQETGLNHFQLRDLDNVDRIGWLTPDPKHQYFSSYISMGNNPISGVDPDGGFKTRAGAKLYNLLHGNKGTVDQFKGGARSGEYFVSNEHGIPGGISAGIETSWGMQEGNANFSANIRYLIGSFSMGVEIGYGNSLIGLNGAARFKMSSSTDFRSMKNFFKDINKSIKNGIGVQAKFGIGVKIGNTPTILTEAKISSQTFLKYDANILGNGGEYKTVLDPTTGVHSHTISVTVGGVVTPPLNRTVGRENVFSGSAKFTD